ncbi:tyrosine-type recombinase/integrase [Nocardioides silvaticus]|nr:tyrosine-type recombinase/integrase [Nocardioides silvaticus]
MTGPARASKRVVLSGPLAEYAPGLAAKLGRRGFLPLSVEHQLRLLAHLSRWMQARGLEVGMLTDARVDEFLVERRATYTALYSRRALRPLLEHLGGLGVLPVEEPPPATPTDLAVAGFEQYLLTERGLLPKTAAAQAARIRRFLTGYCPAGGVGQLTTVEVTQALRDEGRDHAVSSVKRLGYTIKTFLRYAFLTGLIDRDLTGATVPVKSHQPSLLPIGISREQTAALLAACDRDTVVGRRDYAVILLLARLGLRAIEVARLQLTDIDWHHGEIIVRGKSHRDEGMPLPAEVGQALVDYLMRSRPTDAPELRTVFVAARAPRRRMDRVTVSSMIARTCQRAGIEPVGAHLLRHSLGEDMIRAEVPLPAIAQVLRHHDPLTTANYARVDVERLRSLAVPWPTSASSTISTTSTAWPTGGAR